MDYIKKNKIFILLVISLALIISYLLFLVIQQNSTDTTEETVETDTFEIVSFNTNYDETSETVNVSWHLQDTDEVEKIELYNEDTLVQDVTDLDNINLTIGEDIDTGNNNLTLLVTLSDGTTIDEDSTLYLDEAYDCSVKEDVKDNYILYTLSYKYDSKKSVDVPSVNVSGTDQPFKIDYKDASQTSDENGIVSVEAIYKLTFQDVEEGTYNLSVTWNFVPYEVHFNKDIQIQVNGGKDDESED